MAILTVVGLPIDQNWRLLDPRAVLAVQECELLVAEERKNALRLLAATESRGKPFLLTNEHTTDAIRQEILAKILSVSRTVLVSDAGTPCVADPDYRLVDMCIKHGVEIRSISGASSVMTALSVSGFDCSRFMFMGFPPRNNGKNGERKKFFDEIANAPHVVVFLERPYHLRQTLDDMQKISKDVSLSIDLGGEQERTYRGKIHQIAPLVEGVKGAFAVVVNK